MHYSLSLIDWILISGPVLATCIVILRNDQEIIVGADSRRRKSKGDGFTDDVVQDDYCKIRQAGEYYYTLVGYHDYFQKEHANFAAANSNNFNGFASTFLHNLKAEYERWLEGVRADNPEEYNEKFVLPGGLLAEIAIFKIENETPRLVVFAFYNETHEGRPIFVNVYIKDNENFRILGVYQEYYSLPIAERHRFENLKQSDPIAFIKEVIDFEGNIHPDWVGGTKYILRLSSDNKEWVDGLEPVC